MALVTRRRCDQCKAEVEVGDARLGAWYEVWRNNIREWNEAGDSERFDLCSLPCLSAWAHSRELVRTAS